MRDNLVGPFTAEAFLSYLDALDVSGADPKLIWFLHEEEVPPPEGSMFWAVARFRYCWYLHDCPESSGTVIEVRTGKLDASFGHDVCLHCVTSGETFETGEDSE